MPENHPRFQSRVRRPPPEPEALDVKVLHEDESLIAIDKAPGMVVHPTYLNWSGTLLNAVLWHVRGRPGISPRIVTRLDKDTSGVVLIALTPEIHAQVQRGAAAGWMSKEYLALVRGTPAPPRGSIELPLGRSQEDRRRVVVTPTGQHSLHQVRGAVVIRRTFVGPMRASDWSHAPDPRAPCRTGMADRRRPRVRKDRRDDGASGAARLAPHPASPCDRRTAGDRGARAVRPPAVPGLLRTSRCRAA